MSTTTLVYRSLIYYWRSNVAVVAGVAAAVAVLAGALLVGDSVRGSLRDLVTERLGKTDEVISSAGFFREELAGDIRSDSRFAASFGDACPLIIINGIVSDQRTGRRASSVQVYGVDDRFWKFQGLEASISGPADRDALLSPALARLLDSQPGEAVLLRIEKPTAIPADSLLGRKDDLGRTIRLNVRAVLPTSSLGEFSIRPGQGEVRAMFVPLSRLQRDLEQPRGVNLILIKDSAGRPASQSANHQALSRIASDTCVLQDLGIKLRLLDRQRGIALESDRGFISDSLYSEAKAAIDKSGGRLEPILSYLANAIRGSSREVPYSVVTGLSPESFDALSTLVSREKTSEPRGTAAPATASSPGPVALEQLPPIILNDWAARDLQVHPGDQITLDYFLWEDQGALSTHSAVFRLAGVVPVNGPAGDRDLVPDYPGITTTQNIADWDPPFPVDLRKVRPVDEQYWHEYRTTPKAFVLLDAAQRLWQSRYGKLTSGRVLLGDSDAGAYLESFRTALRTAMDPAENGLLVNSVRIESIIASQGATDFGEYFVYFSFFLVVGALLLASMFFKLGIEQRLREIGILRAAGFPISALRGMFVEEGAVLAAAGGIVGMLGAVGYGALLMFGLRTWWVGAVGTTALRLHVSFSSLLVGAAGGVVAALLCVVWTLRQLASASPKSLLTGSPDALTGRASSARLNGGRGPRWRSFGSNIFGRHSLALAAMLAVAGLALLLLASLNLIGKTEGFFGAGTLLLLSALVGERAWLRREVRSPIRGRGWMAVTRLGFRNASYRAGRSVLCIALIASASFIIVAVESFKQSSKDSTADRRSGSGGVALLAQSQLPLYHDPNTSDGREALNVSAVKGFDPDTVVFSPFRVRPGDDTSCLNLYQPRDPKILAPTEDFIRSGRFSFEDSLAGTKEERDNPWLLLLGEQPDGATPVIADANSITYVLRRKLGDDLTLNPATGAPIRLRLVAALSDSIFQGELLMSDKNFLKLFPERGGYSFFLLDVAPGAVSVAPGVLDQQLSDFGFEVTPTAERLAAFHRVENTYLTTFEALGGLGLVLGTLGLAAVLLRNVLERRRELGLLRAIGYNSGDFALMVLAENAVLVCCGLVTGSVCALVAIGPAFVARGGHFPALSLGMMLVVLVTGLLASLGATIASLRMPLLASLRAE